MLEGIGSEMDDPRPASFMENMPFAGIARYMALGAFNAHKKCDPDPLLK